MKDDLDKNSLLDDGIDVSKKVMSGYEKAQKVSFYFMVAKGAGALVALIIVLWVGSMIVGSVKDMVTAAAIGEAKEVANEKLTVAKDKITSIRANAKKKIKLVKEKHGTGNAPETQSITSTLFAFAKSIDDTIEDAADGVLIENGFDPSASATCAFQPMDDLSPGCLIYSSVEISGDEYSWIKLSWRDDPDCVGVYGKAMNILKLNGKITENDKRILQSECIDNRNMSGDAAREDRKRKMLEEL